MKKIIQQNRSFIRSIIKKLTGSYDEDIEQEVYIKTWNNMQNYREQGRFKQWLGALTANVCRDYFRSKMCHERTREVCDEEMMLSIADEHSQEKVIEAKARQKLILKAVDELPIKMRKVIILHEFEDIPIELIAKKLNIPEGTVKSRLFNAKQILKEKLIYLKGEQI